MINRKLLLGVITATMISSGLLGCANQNPNKTTNDTSKSISNSSETNKTGQTEQMSSISDSTDKKVVNETSTSSPNSSTNNNTVEETYYGQWQINKELASAPVTTYSNDDIKNIIGKELTFSKESASCFGDKVSDLNYTAVNPTYKKSVISKSDFVANNRVTLDKLGVKGDTITRIDAADVKGNGCTFFIKDNNALILYGGGVYFELGKIDSNSENTKTQILSNNSVLEAYKAVLQNKTEFFSTDNKKKKFLNDFLTNREIYGTIFKVTHFAVIDMDGDKIPEVVLELSVGDEPQFYEVLHNMKDTVYGYLIVYRGLEGLKADGTFSFSSGAADNGWGKLRFESNALKTDILGYSKSSQGNTNLTISYFINNKPVTKESFDSFINEQSGKKDAVWYEFSQNNIGTELSVNP